MIILKHYNDFYSNKMIFVLRVNFNYFQSFSLSIFLKTEPKAN
jgi:hypothetical protein